MYNSRAVIKYDITHTHTVIIIIIIIIIIVVINDASNT